MGMRARVIERVGVRKRKRGIEGYRYVNEIHRERKRMRQEKGRHRDWRKERRDNRKR